MNEEDHFEVRRFGEMTMTEEATGQTTGGNSSEAGGERPKTTGSIIFSMPLELKDQIESAAKEQKVPVGSYVRKLVADQFGYTLPASSVGRARKYATAEERVAAQRQKQAERNELIKKLLADYRAKAAAGEVV